MLDEQKGTEKPATDESGPPYEQIGRLQMELTAPVARLAQKKIGDFPMSQRRAMLEPTHLQLSMRRQCNLLEKGSFYLLAILDLHSCYVLHWQLSNTLEADWCVDALKETLKKWGKPLIFNTDQGSQFTSNEFIGVLQSHQIAISWDGKGRAGSPVPLDNIFVERFWPACRCASAKYENVYLNRYEDGLALRQGLNKYMTYYNQRRPYQSLEYKTPATVLAEGE